LTELIAQGESTIETILPAECIQPEPKKNRRYDTALLFLIYPLQLVPATTANQILDNIITHLQGDYGIRRYLGDSYWCANYKKKLPPQERTRDWSESIEERDRLLADGEQAQWCVFDPILSIIFGLKFQHHQQPQDLQQQIYYLNRSLGQITGEDSEFGELKCPELYHREDDHYVPSDATPLLWTQANLAVALNMMETSLSVGVKN
ncbi:MAG: phosphorylase kinase, partial [Coleofasciculus sp. E1-EBD-02]